MYVIPNKIRALMIWTTLALGVPTSLAQADALSAIARCESGGQQFEPNGILKRNRLSGAMGKYQFLPFHLRRAQSLGMDLRTLKGNEAYARVVFREEGTTPWNASRHCWGRSASR